MKAIIKEITYELENVNEMFIEIQIQENAGWMLWKRSAIEKNPKTEKLNVTIIYNLNKHIVSNSLDLCELERRVDETLGRETRKTLTKWIKQ